MITFWTIANCDGHCYRCSSNTPPFLNWSHSLQWLLCRLPALAEATYRDHFCRLASSCVVVGVTKNFCHIFLWNHRGQLPDIWHRASEWRTVSCNAVLNLRLVHFLFYSTLNIVDIGKFAYKIISVTFFSGTTQAFKNQNQIMQCYDYIM